MDDLKQKLSAYGADVEGAMERFIDDIDLYEMCLNELFKDANIVQLKEAVEAGDTHNAFLHAHALKGVVGNLGLTPLYEKLIAQVEPLRVDDSTRMMELYLEVEQEFNRLRQEVL
ncbi:MAG: Hpt domain-containing protein [Eubacterium sp.]|nr:Hpt domain-containing protein [Eubacterium sp.]